MQDNENPLKGLKVFLLAPRLEISSKAVPKMRALVERECACLGNIIPIDMIKNTKQLSGIDPSVIDCDAYLCYEIRKLCSLEGKNMGIQTALYVKTNVQTADAETPCETTVWYRNCMLNGDLDTMHKEAISKSLHYLIEELLLDYMRVNREKPSIKCMR